jgi:hypothetical protein
LLIIELFSGLTLARPQLHLQDSSSVSEVVKPEDKEAVLNNFFEKSVLYRSLPEFQNDSGPYEFVVTVESALLRLTKPKDRDAKRREKAEKRVQNGE